MGVHVGRRRESSGVNEWFADLQGRGALAPAGPPRRRRAPRVNYRSQTPLTNQPRPRPYVEPGGRPTTVTARNPPQHGVTESDAEAPRTGQSIRGRAGGRSPSATPARAPCRRTTIRRAACPSHVSNGECTVRPWRMMDVAMAAAGSADHASARARAASPSGHPTGHLGAGKPGERLVSVPIRPPHRVAVHRSPV